MSGKWPGPSKPRSLGEAAPWNLDGVAHPRGRMGTFTKLPSGMTATGGCRPSCDVASPKFVGTVDRDRISFGRYGDCGNCSTKRTQRLAGRRGRAANNRSMEAQLSPRRQSFRMELRRGMRRSHRFRRPKATGIAVGGALVLNRALRKALSLYRVQCPEVSNFTAPRLDDLELEQLLLGSDGLLDLTKPAN
jgi:hypothetical protein